MAQAGAGWLMDCPSLGAAAECQDLVTQLLRVVDPACRELQPTGDWQAADLEPAEPEPGAAAGAESLPAAGAGS